MPPPTAVITSESFKLSIIVLINAIKKNKTDMGMNLSQRPSNRANCCTIESRAATKMAKGEPDAPDEGSGAGTAAAAFTECAGWAVQTGV